MSRISALIRRGQKLTPPLFLTHEDTAVCHPEEGPQQRTNRPGTLILDFQALIRET